MNRGQRRAAWLAQHRQRSEGRAKLSAASPDEIAPRPLWGGKIEDVVPHPSLQLHVEELHLHGFASRDRHVIGESLQRELTRLIVDQGISPVFSPGSDAARLDAGTITVASGARPHTVGAQIARAVYGGPQR